jgi:hypothetical protein
MKGRGGRDGGRGTSAPNAHQCRTGGTEGEKGREGKGREGKGREGKGRKEGLEGRLGPPMLDID